MVATRGTQYRKTSVHDEYAFPHARVDGESDSPICPAADSLEGLSAKAAGLVQDTSRQAISTILVVVRMAASFLFRSRFSAFYLMAQVDPIRNTGTDPAPPSYSDTRNEPGTLGEKSEKLESARRGLMDLPKTCGSNRIGA